MARRTPLEVRTIAKASWAAKQPWLHVIDECYQYFAPGLNPLRQNPQGGAPRPARGSDLRSEGVFDGTGIRALGRLASRLKREFFPQGQQWALMEPGAFLAPGQDVTEVHRSAMQETTEVAFSGLAAGGWDEAAEESIFDGGLSGVGLMKGGLAPGPDVLLDFESVNQVECAFEHGLAGKIWGFNRMLWLTREMIQAYYPEAENLPANERDAVNPAMPKRHTVHEATYLSPLDGIWHYDVVLDGDAGPVSMYERDYLVCPWVAWRYMRMSGDVQGRSPAMQALPDVRVLNHVKRIRLQAANIRSVGVYTVLHDGIFNPRTARFKPGALLTVGSNARENPTIQALPLSGDIQLNEIIIEDLVASIKDTMLDHPLPDAKGPVRSPTEIVERIAEAREKRGQPGGRLTQEMGIPSLRLALYLLQEAGQLPKLSEVRPPVGGAPQPLRLDGTDVKVVFTGRQARTEALNEARNVVEWAETSRSIAGEEAYLSRVKVEDIPVRLNELMGADPDLLRTDEETAPLFDDRLADRAGAGGGAAMLPELPAGMGGPDAAP